SVSFTLLSFSILSPYYLCLSFFFFSCSGDHLDLHSFPTRRSSDLISPPRCQSVGRGGARAERACQLRNPQIHEVEVGTRVRHGRSEEHTSELQSRGHLVCRLLLEKKKKECNTE